MRRSFGFLLLALRFFPHKSRRRGECARGRSRQLKFTARPLVHESKFFNIVRFLRMTRKRSEWSGRYWI